MIPRLIEKQVIKCLTSLPVLTLILGARQVGKTVLVKHIQSQLEHTGKKVLFLNCDLEESLAAVDSTSLTVLAQLVKNTDYLFLDEAQRLTNAGLTLKILLDNFPNLKVLATGSSSFELKNHLSDALTGRYVDFVLYPLSFTEILATQDTHKAQALLPSALLYGLYPGIYQIGDPSQKQMLLRKIIESYLFKDILSFQKIRYSQAIKDLTAAIAYQVGSEINEDELAKRIKIDRKTVVSYLDILEKSYVIFRLYPFSKNPRREIGRKYKIYFTDLGIRNALIDDFHLPILRSDLGHLWENFLIVERLKAYANVNQPVSPHFWRSYSGAEVDYLERASGPLLSAFEIKYSVGNLSKGAHSFTKNYRSPVTLISNDNFLSFINPVFPGNSQTM